MNAELIYLYAMRGWPSEDRDLTMGQMKHLVQRGYVTRTRPKTNPQISQQLVTVNEATQKLVDSYVNSYK